MQKSSRKIAVAQLSREKRGTRGKISRTILDARELNKKKRGWGGDQKG